MPNDVPRREDLLGSLLGASRPAETPPIIINAAPGATVIIYTHPPAPESQPASAKNA